MSLLGGYCGSAPAAAKGAAACWPLLGLWQQQLASNSSKAAGAITNSGQPAAGCQQPRLAPHQAGCLAGGHPPGAVEHRGAVAVLRVVRGQLAAAAEGRRQAFVWLFNRIMCIVRCAPEGSQWQQQWLGGSGTSSACSSNDQCAANCNRTALLWFLTDAEAPHLNLVSPSTMRRTAAPKWKLISSSPTTSPQSSTVSCSRPVAHRRSTAASSTCQQQRAAAGSGGSNLHSTCCRQQQQRFAADQQHQKQAAT